jgi:predicted transcriptional regulator
MRTTKIKILPRRERRNKLEIYNDILIAIKDESKNGEVKPTRIQLRCNLSYDKFSNYLEELRRKDLIRNSLTITPKGQKLLQDYERISQFIKKMQLDYVDVKEIPYET